MVNEKETGMWICRGCANEHSIPLDTSKRKTGKLTLISYWGKCPICLEEGRVHKVAKVEKKKEVIRL